MKDSVFKKTIQNYYNTNKRDFPWRNTSNPYMILVSEIMLQQTQTSRVLTKYNEFIKKFPTIKKLACATQSEVLTMWQGLGYNRRALNLKKTAELIYKNHKGVFPKEYKELMKLPGIGQSTASALLNFSFNTPTPFIETNIRAVYLHFYFKHSTSVSDEEVLSLVCRTMNTENPKDWFYALYDYGAHLKSMLGKKKSELHAKSKTYIKQKPFKGSNREIRSRLLKFFLSHSNTYFSIENIVQTIPLDMTVLVKNLQDLQREGFLTISLKNSLWRLKL